MLSSRDHVVDSNAARDIFGSYAGEPKKLIVTEEAGHVIPLDVGWEGVVEEVAGFVR